MKTREPNRTVKAPPPVVLDVGYGPSPSPYSLAERRRARKDAAIYEAYEREARRRGRR